MQRLPELITIPVLTQLHQEHGVLIHDGEVYQDVIISQADCEEEEEEEHHQDIVVTAYRLHSVGEQTERTDDFGRETKAVATNHSCGHTDNNATNILSDVSCLADEVASIVNIRCSTFVDDLPELFRSANHADTLVRCADGARRVHSLVLAAASSLLRRLLGDAADNTDGSADLTILVPDLRLVDLEAILGQLYGEGVEADTTPEANIFGMDFNRGIIAARPVKSEVREQQAPFAATTFFDAVAAAASGNDQTEIITSVSDDGIVNGLVRRRIGGRKRRKKRQIGEEYDEDFIDDAAEDVENLNPAEEVEEDFQVKSVKRKRGRPRKIKVETKEEEEEEEQEVKRVAEPIVMVKEEGEFEMERALEELRAFFGEQEEQQVAVVRPSHVRQDHCGLYHCQVANCGFESYIFASVEHHVRHKHLGVAAAQGGVFDCPQCGESWRDPVLFNRHVDSNECYAATQPPYVCETCGKGWFNLSSYTSHAEIAECRDELNTQEGKTKCINCSQSFYSLKNREVHVKRAHALPTDANYRCVKCDISFKTGKEASRHRKEVHLQHIIKAVRFKCRMADCGFECEGRKELEQHVTEHVTQQDQVHICPTCGRNFPDAEKLDNHTSGPVGRGGKKCLPVNYNCPHCPREFNRKRHMELHVLFKHTQDRPFVCGECGKRFKTQHCVNIHLRSHGIGGYSWCCEECGKTFNQISAYHVHLKVHSNVRDFACEDCGMTFKLKHSLKKHQLTHKAEFQHTCDFCGKKFKRSDNLINHRRRHTGEHPYKCGACNWTGPDSSSFIHHKKKHTEALHNPQELKLLQAMSRITERRTDRFLERESIPPQEEGVMLTE